MFALKVKRIGKRESRPRQNASEWQRGRAKTYIKPQLKLMDLQNQLCKLIFSFFVCMRVLVHVKCAFSCQYNSLLLLRLFCCFLHCRCYFFTVFFFGTIRSEKKVSMCNGDAIITFKYEPLTVKFELHFIVRSFRSNHNTFFR